MDTFESGYVYMGLENSFKMNINEYAKKIVRDGFPARKPKSKKDLDFINTFYNLTNILLNDTLLMK